jgi:hypothetical protein
MTDFGPYDFKKKKKKSMYRDEIVFALTTFRFLQIRDPAISFTRS